jgi:hypothetical protein
MLSEHFGHTAILSRLPEPLSAQLFAGAKSCRLRVGDALFAVGDSGDGCYRLERGLLKVHGFGGVSSALLFRGSEYFSFGPREQRLRPAPCSGNRLESPVRQAGLRREIECVWGLAHTPLSYIAILRGE